MNLLSPEHLDNVSNFLKFYQNQHADIDTRLSDVNSRISGIYLFLCLLLISLENRKNGNKLRGEIGTVNRKQNEKINEVVIEVNASEKAKACFFFCLFCSVHGLSLRKKQGSTCLPKFRQFWGLPMSSQEPDGLRATTHV